MSGLNDRYIFGPFELITNRNVLMADGVPATLGSRAMQILCILVMHADQVVNGQYLLNQVWPDTAVVEINLRVHLGNIRKHPVAATGETNVNPNRPGAGLPIQSPRGVSQNDFTSAQPIEFASPLD